MVTTIDFTYDPREPSWTISHVGGRPRMTLGPAVADSDYHSQRLVLMLLELCEGITPGDAAARLDSLIIQNRHGGDR